MKLSNRLEMVVSFVKPGNAAADVGTDHGHVPVELVRRGVVSRAYAMDVAKGPLSKAEENIALAGMKDRIETRLSDGVRKLSAGEADTVIIAGMGGELVIHILEDGRHVWDTVSQWVLSPHSELHKVREWLDANGFVIVKEDMVFEEEKYYTVMDVRPGADGAGPRTGSGHEEVQVDGAGETSAEDRPGAGNVPRCEEKRFRYSPYLTMQKHPVFRDYLKDEEKKLEALCANLERQAEHSARAQESLNDTREKLAMNREVQHEM